MQITDIPTKFDIPFASSAGVGFRRAIPKASQIGVTPGAASLVDGFPPLNFQQIAAGGVPPWGADMNGLMYQSTLWLRWAAAGGVPVKYDATFSTAIGGYPKGAFLQAASFTNQGRYWISSVDNNTTNPDSGGANWIAFPDVNVQLQTPNYAVDTGITNQVQIALSRTPASFAEIVGAPIRFKVANVNTITNPTIDINGTGQKVIVCPDGSPLEVAQLVVGGIAEGLPRDDNKFQLSFPPKPSSAPPSGSWPIPGFVMPWPTETVPAGFIECSGALLTISSWPTLWAVLGSRYGGDGVSNFRLPDYRGEFLRGWDHGRGLDPAAGARTNAGGGLTGDHVGTNEADAVKTITGTLNLLNPIGTAHNWWFNASDPPPAQYQDYSSMLTVARDPPTAGVVDRPSPSHPSTLGFTSLSTDLGDAFGNHQITKLSGDATILGSSENRPVNIYVMWVMAF